MGKMFFNILATFAEFEVSRATAYRVLDRANAASAR
jgi:hypothetical protein